MYALNFSRLGLSLLALSSLAFAHPEDDKPLHPNVIARRQLEAESRQAATAKCARQIAEYNTARRMKRSLFLEGTNREVKRQVEKVPGSSYEIPEKDQPTYKTIQNNTCVVAPEVTEGPYFVESELLRNDIREDQPGVDLFLDIGVIDIRTCQPLPKALVEIWACNSTGYYSSFTKAPPAIAKSFPLSTDPLFTNIATRSAIIEKERYPPIGKKTDEASPISTWLRGAYPTNDHGLVEFKTKYPGYYTGRAIHIHTIITTNWTYLTNGTIESKSGNTRHVGQVFFDEELNDQVLATPAYQNSTQIRLENYRDAVLAPANSQGHNAFVDHVMLGKTVEDGILAYITIGVDSSFEGSIITNNTWQPTKVSPRDNLHEPMETRNEDLRVAN
ncbi:protocatechuate 3,4-dioxygenase beta subunit, putative [Rhizoctonia solani AG-3 Rhs1AP]|uniref:Protocatechuate 3,4-dioxygenase beta subunit, putative n=2 Tax=Rhizoctonia solani AG-3 TaxID=1086053 RepID=X8IZB2_9AGAM|nr:protocatechuate 3,4-dioxygenase beta subunit, putative [Rhizoctonia solani AG-3 Rhs1AP]KEP49174.1 putative protocatechuate 3,4-dioxygenase beta subunit [Rhizoctonia solani 123E]